MKFSTRIRYGLRAMVDIAQFSNEEGVLQKDIAERQGISLKYLDHIITALKVSRLIQNAKGKKSGYVLSRPASEISILDIHNAFEPGINVVDCMESGFECDKSGFCSSQMFWCKLNRDVNDHFKNTSLQDMVTMQNEFDQKKAAIQN